MSSSHLHYRKDIDGLRAIAILSVIGFHAFPDIFKGGFVGVDIFFVISGYLISSIILTQLEAGKLNLTDFYERRVRRIFPALLTVTFSSLIFGWFFLFWDEYAVLGKHVAGGIGFVSNFILAKGQAYFDRALETKPMLHLWSLAIEEQFYLFWPLLLMLLWRKRSWIPYVIFFVGFISFSVMLNLIHTKPVAAFYWPISRFWELMVGGILAYFSLFSKRLNSSYQNLQSILGFLLITMGLLLINKNSLFPSWVSLLPTMGAFFLISSGPTTFLNKHLLANRVMVFIGLISYPLYLWHWPLLSFTRIMVGQDPALIQKIYAILLTFLLASLTYFFIEKKIRRPGSVIRTKALIIVAIAIFAISISIKKINGGFPGRGINQKIKSMVIENIGTQKTFNASRESDKSCQNLLGIKPIKEEVCLTNTAAPKVLFIGDSHAMALYSSIFAKDMKLDATLMAAHGCHLYPNLNYTSTYLNNWGNDCQEIAQNIIQHIKQMPSIKSIILTTQYPFDSDSSQSDSIYNLQGKKLNNEDAFLLGEGKLISDLMTQGKNVTLVLDVPHLKYDPRDCVQRSALIKTPSCDIALSEHLEAQGAFLDQVKKLQNKFPKLRVFDSRSIFCDQLKCNVKDDTGYLYFDSHHMTIHASFKTLSKMQSQQHF